MIAAALAILSIISGLVIIASAIFNRDTLFHYKADSKSITAKCLLWPGYPGSSLG